MTHPATAHTMFPPDTSNASVALLVGKHKVAGYPQRERAKSRNHNGEHYRTVGLYTLPCHGKATGIAGSRKLPQLLRWVLNLLSTNLPFLIKL